ncbi:hypothetical protein [Runella limosa]|uniref:hypothetical protein n=1 Tax=Runella limosa TaxID=370978 RepID=UPI0004290064|nr:hypothetical protein [Runella limosa]
MTSINSMPYIFEQINEYYTAIDLIFFANSIDSVSDENKNSLPYDDFLEVCKYEKKIARLKRKLENVKL